MRLRFYDPEIGRFLSPDILSGGMDDALSTNPYIYVKNSPINMVDPLGAVGLSTLSAFVKRNDHFFPGLFDAGVDKLNEAVTFVGIRMSQRGKWKIYNFHR